MAGKEERFRSLAPWPPGRSRSPSNQRKERRPGSFEPTRNGPSRPAADLLLRDPNSAPTRYRRRTATHDIHQRGLAGAVGPMRPTISPGLDLHCRALKGSDPAETDGHAIDLQRRRAGNCASAPRPAPRASCSRLPASAKLIPSMPPARHPRPLWPRLPRRSGTPGHDSSEHRCSAPRRSRSTQARPPSC